MVFGGGVLLLLRRRSLELRGGARSRSAPELPRVLANKAGSRR